MKTNSNPLTFSELKEGQKFTFFPEDGDDSGHGGFRGGGYLFTKLRATAGSKGENSFNHRSSALQKIDDHEKVYLIHCDDLQVR